MRYESEVPIMGYVEQLPSGRYRGVPWNAAAGKRGKSATFDRWAQADAYWRRVEGELDGDYTSAGIEVTRQGRKVGFAAYVLDVARAVEGELATRNSALSHARMLGRRWPTETVDEIDRPDVRAYLAQLRAAGCSASVLQGRIWMLRKAMTAAVEDRLRGDDPTIGLSGPAIPERHQRILTEQELYLMLVYLPAWLWPAALLCHDAGLRIGEVAGLRWFRLDLLHRAVEVADVILEDGTLRPKPKGGKPLTVPLTARVVTALTSHQRDYPAGPMGHVFHDPTRSNGCPCSTSCEATHPRLRCDRIRDTWNRALTAAKLPKPAPVWHDLRHGCATGLALAGASAPVIQEVLRHADLKTSQRYIDRTGMGSQAAGFLAQAFGGTKPAEAAADDRAEDAS